MILERVNNADLLNRVVNHPAVRPWVVDDTHDGELDLSAQVADPNNICLAGEHGVFLCFRYFPCFYECHTQVLPSGRGAWTVEFAKAGAHYMFTATDCIEILTRVPKGHLAATALTRYMQFRPQFTTPPETRFRGKIVPVTVYSMTIQDWALRQDSLAIKGAEFHDWLNRQVAVGTPHPPDPDHNLIVGVALSMIEAGRPAKGVSWYNRAAFAARHPPVALLSIDPPTVRFDAGVLTMGKGGELCFTAG